MLDKSADKMLSKMLSKNITDSELVSEVINDPEYGDELDNNQILVGVDWYNTVGIVITFDFYERRYKSYISPLIPGNSEVDDIQNIASRGSKFPLEAAKQLFPYIDFNLDVVEVMASHTKEVKQLT